MAREREWTRMSEVLALDVKTMTAFAFIFEADKPEYVWKPPGKHQSFYLLYLCVTPRLLGVDHWREIFFVLSLLALMLVIWSNKRVLVPQSERCGSKRSDCVSFYFFGQIPSRLDVAASVQTEMIASI